jgi:tRNA(Met) C34 N-acetyltransferase TmcA
VRFNERFLLSIASCKACVLMDDHGKLSQVELLVIDEADAIPLPIVRSMLGPYLVFLSSTVNGYEGTGRSLSLKLLQQLEWQSQPRSIYLLGASPNKQYREGCSCRAWHVVTKMHT